MATGILLIGEPGSGKTASLRTLNPKTTIIIAPNTKDLTFPGAAKNYRTNANYLFVQQLISVKALFDKANASPHIKTVVVEDLTHFVAKRVIGERADKTYDKWTELAAHIKEYIIDPISSMRPDLFVVLIGHVTSTSDSSGLISVDIQTPGKLLDNVVKIPSYFTYCFQTVVLSDSKGNSEYMFLTNRTKTHSAKSSMGCFKLYIPNDMEAAIEQIKKYRMEEGITPVGYDLPPRPKGKDGVVEKEAKDTKDDKKSKESEKTEEISANIEAEK